MYSFTSQPDPLPTVGGYHGDSGFSNANPRFFDGLQGAQPTQGRDEDTRPYSFGSGYSSASKGECQDQQCAEEECDPEECGDEKRPPKDDNYTCGVDRRPLLPFALITSTLLGAGCMLMLHRPLLRLMLGGSELFTFIFLVLYSATLYCMAYCGLCDPGQLEREDQVQKQLLPAEKQDRPLPRRAHKAWLYALPIRRYDHYCRWLTNCIGLLNHREFIMMCTGLVSIGAFGCLVDIILFFPAAAGGTWQDLLFLILHFGYSMMLVVMAGPILRLHIGLISRNELAHDWKKSTFYCVKSHRTGQKVYVNDLSDEEFNERFDSFEYDMNRNPWDRGLQANCISFWCTPRWQPGQLGDF